MKPLVRWALVGALLAAAGPAWGGEVKLSFSHGLVTLIATDASPREILSEWARLGQVRVTNLDRLAGAPVTLQMTDVPELRALETILRGTAGYVAAPRREVVATVSGYDRILLMPGLAPAIPVVAASPRPSTDTAGERGRFGQPPFGMPGGDAGSAGTQGFAPARGGGITPLGPNRQVMQGAGRQSFVVAQPVTDDETADQPTQMPTSSQVPGLPVGSPGQASGSPARPGEMTAPATTPPRNPYGIQSPTVVPPGQPSTGPIKVPE